MDSLTRDVEKIFNQNQLMGYQELYDGKTVAYKAVKRLFDIMAASAAFIVLSPVFIDQLRKLVHAILSYKFSNLCNSRIILDLKSISRLLILLLKRRKQLIRIFKHAPEFIHPERLHILARPRLDKEYRSSVLQQYSKSRHKKNRR